LIIYYKIKTKLVKKFMDIYDFHIYKIPNLKDKLFSKKQNIDIFFHTGAVNKQDIKLINITNILIVSSKKTKDIVSNNPKIKINDNQIFVIYPVVDIPKINKQDKKDFLKSRNLNKKTTILYFTAKEFKTTGVSSFLNIIKNLKNKNFVAIISGDKLQLKPTVSLLQEMGLSKKVILIQEDMYNISDIFILPTSNKLLSYSVLKAMSYKNVVFLPQTNSASELLDSFSIMNSSIDSSIGFRVDMLLESKGELKIYQKNNIKIAKQLTLNKQFKKLKKIIKNNKEVKI